MGLADLHIHTTYSWDGTCSVTTVLRKAVDLGLNVIAITDHDEVRGGLEALELAPRYPLEVIPGCEISTAEGHLVALFVQQPIPKGLSLAASLERVGKQGGCAIAAHPVARGVNSLSEEAILGVLADPDLRRVLVGIEVFNAGLFHLKSNRRAQAFADALPYAVAQVGSSDAHMSWMIGNAATHFAGSTALALRQALEAGATQAVHFRLFPRLKVLSDWIMRYVLRSAGWVGNERVRRQPLPVRSARLQPSGIPMNVAEHNASFYRLVLPVREEAEMVDYAVLSD